MWPVVSWCFPRLIDDGGAIEVPACRTRTPRLSFQQLLERRRPKLFAGLSLQVAQDAVEARPHPLPPDLAFDKWPRLQTRPEQLIEPLPECPVEFRAANGLPFLLPRQGGPDVP